MTEEQIELESQQEDAERRRCDRPYPYLSHADVEVVRKDCDAQARLYERIKDDPLVKLAIADARTPVGALPNSVVAACVSAYLLGVIDGIGETASVKHADDSVHEMLKEQTVC